MQSIGLIDRHFTLQTRPAHRVTAPVIRFGATPPPIPTLTPVTYKLSAKTAGMLHLLVAEQSRQDWLDFKNCHVPVLERLENDGFSYETMQQLDNLTQPFRSRTIPLLLQSYRCPDLARQSRYQVAKHLLDQVSDPQKLVLPDIGYDPYPLYQQYLGHYLTQKIIPLSSLMEAMGPKAKVALEILDPKLLQHNGFKTAVSPHLEALEPQANQTGLGHFLKNVLQALSPSFLSRTVKVQLQLRYIEVQEALASLAQDVGLSPRQLLEKAVHQLYHANQAIRNLYQLSQDSPAPDGPTNRALRLMPEARLILTNGTDKKDITELLI